MHTSAQRVFVGSGTLEPTVNLWSWEPFDWNLRILCTTNLRSKHWWNTGITPVINGAKTISSLWFLHTFWYVHPPKIWGRIPGWLQYYCWWLKSCTTWDVWNPINNGKNYLSTGAGFQPSTVWLFFCVTWGFSTTSCLFLIAPGVLGLGLKPRPSLESKALVLIEGHRIAARFVGNVGSMKTVVKLIKCNLLSYALICWCEWIVICMFMYIFPPIGVVLRNPSVMSCDLELFIKLICLEKNCIYMSMNVSCVMKLLKEVKFHKQNDINQIWFLWRW